MNKKKSETSWIPAHSALVRLWKYLNSHLPKESDPAPWYEPAPFYLDSDPASNPPSYSRENKAYEAAKLTLLRSMLLGELRGMFVLEAERREVPGWAWENPEHTKHAWSTSRLPIDVFMPDEWQRWSCAEVSFDEREFETWLSSSRPRDNWGLPALPPPHDAQFKPRQVQTRRPPDMPYVTLSEALTWVAFGVALDRDSLDRAISGNTFDATDPQSALSAAMAKLALRASGGQIAARGKYVESHSTDENEVLTAPIDPVRFEDFAQFDILYDGLRYGTGLTWNMGSSALERALQKRRDAFRSVKVSRADLLKLFPDQDDTARAFFVPLPAALPEIGPVMPLHEAFSWLALGKPSHDIDVWQNAAGDLIFRDPSGAVIEPRADGAPPPFIATYRQASRTIHGALRDGSLPAYVAPTSVTPLVVPRFYWNGVNPESLHHVYRGMTPDDHGTECPILLSRLAFDEWRAAIAAFHNAGGDRAPSVKAGRPPCDDEILAKADEMKARGLDGRTIAKQMRLEPGFENVATTAVRDLTKGRWKPAGRPKKGA